MDRKGRSFSSVAGNTLDINEVPTQMAYNIILQDEAYCSDEGIVVVPFQKANGSLPHLLILSYIGECL